MKLLIVLLALIAASWALPRSSVKPDPDIVYDLNQFLQCMNRRQMQLDTDDALKHDLEVVKVMLYIVSDEFKDQIKVLDKEPTYLAILKDLEEHGAPAFEFINEFLRGLHIDPIDQLAKIQVESHSVGSFDSLYDKLIADVDGNCTKQVFEDRLKADPKFVELVAHVHSDEFKELLEAFKESTTLKQTVDKFNKVGLNLAKYVEYLKKLYHYDV